MSWSRLLAVLALPCALASCAADPAPTAAKPLTFDTAFTAKDVATDTTADSAPQATTDSTPDASTLPNDASAAVSKDTGAGSIPSPWICTSTGLPGCKCDKAADCDSGHCVDTPNDGKVCSANCTDSCPAGWQCVAQGTGDVVFFCLPQWPVLCNPCDSDADCATVGVAKALCVDRGPLGKFCGAGCTADTDCPASYTCQTITSSQAKTGQQCMPAPGKDNAATECTCSKAATAATLGTACGAEAKGKDGKVTGICGGVRQCSPDGLSACSAVVNAETCNGKDDDCNGLVDDVACDDNNSCTTDLCDATALACSHTATSGSCDADNNACTESDSCVEGKCTAGTAKKCDDSNPCTLDACNPAKGCTATQDDGAGCDDGDLCSVGDVCTGGQCQPGKPKLCGIAAACQKIACDGKTGTCGINNQADGTGCDDGTACSEKDLCAGGACNGTVVDCNDTNPCTLDTCDAATGCKHTPNAAPCDDANACTDSDTCKDGACTGTGKPASACSDNNGCTTDACDPKIGCNSAANTAPCDDGNPCTNGDTCKDKACVSGVSTCQCQQDSDCKDDGNLCNGTPFCDKSTSTFACKTNPATIVTCDKGGDTSCALNECAPTTGKCAKVAQADGKSCDADGSVCTGPDTCKAGVCAAGAKLNCDDSNPCSDDACDAKTGCSHVNNASPCDADGNGCTANDTCNAGVCVAGALKNCNDANICTTDSCDKATGACKNDGAILAGQACDADGSLCTSPDLCAAGACKAGAQVNCDDKNPCTTDSCSATKGCQHVNLSDKTGCTTGSWCIANAGGVAQCVKAPVCGDKVVDLPYEQCDDGNTTPNDGCSESCQVEVPPQPKPGELLVTEIMFAPTGSQTYEWVELHNPTNKPLNLEGLWFGDLNYTLKLTKVNGFVMQPGTYALIAASGFSAISQGVKADFVYTYASNQIAFANDSDGVCITYKATDACTPTTTVALVAYNAGKSGWPSLNTGRSYQLDPTKLTYAENVAGASWCNSKVTFGSNGDQGTPGKANSSCP